MEIYLNIPYSNLGSSRSTIKVIKENKLSILPVQYGTENKKVTNFQQMLNRIKTNY